MREIELLCPAKNSEAGITAINYGADAVYIGADKFGARSAAGNSIKDIEQLINYAHKFNAKVYATVNTILDDTELTEAEKLIRELNDIGADAVIIQDLGLLKVDLPNIPLFASTQTHNYDLDRIKFLEKAGFSRIILARELSLNQITEIRANTSIDIESFVYGALCVSFSGQCYMSQALKSRSANRGECAQLCRMKYSLLDETGRFLAKNKYLLSLKDLNLSSYIYDLLQAGVSSFKIEGRLKDINYVKNVTAFFRNKIDEVLSGNSDYKKASSGSTKYFFTPDLEKTYNRGFTNYFINGESGDLTNFDTPKSIGKLIGVVNNMKDGAFEIQTEETIIPGDGLCFVSASGEFQGFFVNKVAGAKIYPNELKIILPGTKIYRNNDLDFEKILKTDKSKRKIECRATLFEIESGLKLEIIDEDGNKVEILKSIENEKAQNPDKAIENYIKQLKKSGDSDFNISEVNVIAEELSFVPASYINALRREGLQALADLRLASYKRALRLHAASDNVYPVENLDYSANVMNSLASAFYKESGINRIDPAFERTNNLAGKTLMTTKLCLRKEFSLCTKNPDGTSNARSLLLVDANNKYSLEFDCKKCVMKIIYNK